MSHRRCAVLSYTFILRAREVHTLADANHTHFAK